MKKRLIAAYTPEGIWGVGQSKKAAMADVFTYTQPGPEENEKEWKAQFRFAPMTARLADFVMTKGFDCKSDSYRVLGNGTLDLVD